MDGKNFGRLLVDNYSTRESEIIGDKRKGRKRNREAKESQRRRKRVGEGERESEKEKEIQRRTDREKQG